MDLQELIALAIVAGTALLMFVRWLRHRGTKTPCGASCDCPASLQLPHQSDILK